MIQKKYFLFPDSGQHIKTANICPLSVNKDDRILVISPHPDDCSISCGGALIQLQKQDIKNISVLIATSGNHAPIKNIKDKKERGHIRKKEVIKEMKTLDIRDYKFLNLPFYEDESEPTQQDCDIIWEQIKQSRPDIVFMSNRTIDSHPTHKRIAKLTLDAFKQMPQEKCKNIQIFEFETPWGILPANRFNTIFALSEDVIERKIKGIHCHISQVKRTPFNIFAHHLAEMHAITIPEEIGMGTKPFELGKYIELFYKTSALKEIQENGN